MTEKGGFEEQVCGGEAEKSASDGASTLALFGVNDAEKACLQLVVLVQSPVSQQRLFA